MPQDNISAPPRAAAPVRIVAIAGVPGSGKTTLATRTAALAGDAALLFFDGFEALTAMPPGALSAWHAEGADFSRFQVAGLAEALAALKAGRPAREAASGRIVAPAPLVLFEMPLGRAFPPARPFIDFLVWLDTPLDVALARNLAAFASQNDDPPAEWLAGYAHNYVTAARPVLLAQKAAVAPGADLVLDGTQSPESLAQALFAAINDTKS